MSTPAAEGDKSVPDITDAFDIVADTFDRAAVTCGTKHHAAKLILDALAKAGFVVMHRDEMQEAIVTAGKIGMILRKSEPASQ